MRPPSTGTTRRARPRAGRLHPAAGFDPAFAADGVDELIMGFAARRRYRLREGGDGGGERSLTVRARDAEGRWHVRLADGGTAVSRWTAATTRRRTARSKAPRPASTRSCGTDPTPPGPASTITGRPEILAVWNTSVRVRW